MYDDEEEPTPILHRITPGDYYLQGFSDGYHNRPKVNHRTKEAHEAYAKGYGQGAQQRQAQTNRKEVQQT